MGSSSSSSNQQQSTTSNQLGYELEDQAQAVGVIGEGNQVMMTDHETVKGAFDLSGQALAFVKDVVGSNNAMTNNAIQNTVEHSINAVQQAQKSGEQQGIDKVLGYIPVVVVVGGLAYILKG